MTPSRSSSVDFDNTEIAFRSRSDAALRRAQLLFKSFGSPLLVSTGPKLVSLALRARLPVTPLIRATLFRQFCGGETIEGSEATMAELARFGIGSILDYSVEALGAENELDEAEKELLRVIEAAAQDKRIPFAVFKATAIARFELLEKMQSGVALSRQEAAERARAEKRFMNLCRTAAARRVRILVDAEETWIQEPIDAWALAAIRELNRETAWVYNTVQLYRRDRLAYLTKLIELAKSESFIAGVKLVRGAYMEKERARAAARGEPSPIQPDKAATDRDFDAALTLCVENIDRIHTVCGSHNERSTRRLIELLGKHGLAANDARVSFAQLLGMSDHLTYNLAHHGYAVAKYVPYGPVRAVLPYLFRRAEENSSIKGQASRELQLIEAEIERRRHH